MLSLKDLVVKIEMFCYTKNFVTQWGQTGLLKFRQVQHGLFLEASEFLNMSNNEMFRGS